MCTVTLSPLKSEKSFVLTSNRDEAPGRPTLPPKIYSEGGVEMLFPKDGIAGGTWLGVSSRKRCICLLNGAFEKHLRKDSYRKSRGVVVREFLVVSDFSVAIAEYDFSGIEPFTLVVAEWLKELKFSEAVWDGEKMHFRHLPLSPHIWSSSPLYTSAAKRGRENWFVQLRKEQELSPKNILDFHYSAGKGDKENGVVMDRNFVRTRSISQIVLSEEKVFFYYDDLETEEVSKMIF